MQPIPYIFQFTRNLSVTTLQHTKLLKCLSYHRFICTPSSNALLSQIDHERLWLVGQIGAVVGPVFVVLVDEGELKCPDDPGEDETGFREEGPVSGDFC